MSPTEIFQKDVERKLSQYFMLKLRKFKQNRYNDYFSLEEEYLRQIEVVKEHYTKAKIKYEIGDLDRVLLSCVSEPKTEYTLGDYTNDYENDSDKNIYSPRVDIAISPVVLKSRGKVVSIGNYRLTEDVILFKKLHSLGFVKEMENSLRKISDYNYTTIGLEIKDYDYKNHCEYFYINKRPLHLFGIEIENQKNPKHLMGDFLNCISLARIPIVLLPEDKLNSCMNMLLFSSTIGDLKEVGVYDLLKNVIVLTIKQFVEIINDFLRIENIEEIKAPN